MKKLLVILISIFLITLSQAKDIEEDVTILGDLTVTENTNLTSGITISPAKIDYDAGLNFIINDVKYITLTTTGVIINKSYSFPLLVGSEGQILVVQDDDTLAFETPDTGSGLTLQQVTDNGSETTNEVVVPSIKAKEVAGLVLKSSDNTVIATIDANGFKLAAGVSVDEISTDDTLTDASDTALVSEGSIKAYVDTEISSIAIGETNTMSNVGSPGVSWFYQKNGVDFEVRGLSLASGENNLTLTSSADENPNTISLRSDPTFDKMTLAQGATTSNGWIHFDDIQGTSYGAGLAFNCYFDGTNWKYLTTGYACIIFFKDNNGFLTRYNIDTGIADTNITLETNQAEFIGALGNVSYGGSIEGGRINVHGTTTGNTSIITTRWSENGGPYLMLQRTDGPYSVYSTLQDGDKVGGIYFNAADGVDLNGHVALIEAYVNGDTALDDTGGGIVFFTQPDGGSTTPELQKAWELFEDQTAKFYVGLKDPNDTNITEFSTDDTLSGASDNVLVTEGSIVAYVAAQIAAIVIPTDISGLPYITQALSGSLSNERRLQGTNGEIDLADGGANGDMVISLPNSPRVVGLSSSDGTNWISTSGTNGGANLEITQGDPDVEDTGFQTRHDVTNNKFYVGNDDTWHIMMDGSTGAMTVNNQSQSGGDFIAKNDSGDNVIHVDADGDLTLDPSGTGNTNIIGTINSSTNPDFKAVSNSSTGHTTGNYTKINWTGESWDNGNNFDFSTNDRFTATTAGVYNFECMVTFGSHAWSNGNLIMLVPRVNGSDYTYRRKVHHGYTEYHSIQISFSVKMAVNDYVEMFLYQNSGGTRSLHTSTLYNRFEGFKRN